ncbi:MAG: hypothetical protein QXY62_06350 [Candidatus Altiarchaeota archaeon]
MIMKINGQKLNPLPDRKALFDIVFDALGLTEEERKEVYFAVAELVKNILSRLFENIELDSWKIMGDELKKQSQSP